MVGIKILNSSSHKNTSNYVILKNSLKKGRRQEEEKPNAIHSFKIDVFVSIILQTKISIQDFPKYPFTLRKPNESENKTHFGLANVNDLTIQKTMLKF